MKALSIRQPWCWCILSAGKDVENRDWSDRSPSLRDAVRLVEDAILDDGCEFLIHAAKGMTRAEYEDCLDLCHAISRRQPFPTGLQMPHFDDLQRGGIVGRAQLYDVVTESESPWFCGRVGLVLRNVKTVPFTPLKGALGFFEVPDNILCDPSQIQSAQLTTA